MKSKRKKTFRKKTLKKTYKKNSIKRKTFRKKGYMKGGWWGGPYGELPSKDPEQELLWPLHINPNVSVRKFDEFNDEIEEMFLAFDKVDRAMMEGREDPSFVKKQFKNYIRGWKIDIRVVVQAVADILVTFKEKTDFDILTINLDNELLDLYNKLDDELADLNITKLKKCLLSVFDFNFGSINYLKKYEGVSDEIFSDKDFKYWSEWRRGRAPTNIVSRLTQGLFGKSKR